MRRNVGFGVERVNDELDDLLYLFVLEFAHEGEVVTVGVEYYVLGESVSEVLELLF